MNMNVHSSSFQEANKWTLTWKVRMHFMASFREAPKDTFHAPTGTIKVRGIVDRKDSHVPTSVIQLPRIWKISKGCNSRDMLSRRCRGYSESVLRTCCCVSLSRKEPHESSSPIGYRWQWIYWN